MTGSGHDRDITKRGPIKHIGFSDLMRPADDPPAREGGGDDGPADNVQREESELLVNRGPHLAWRCLYIGTEQAGDWA